MSKINGMCVATVRQFFGSNEDPAVADKNGKMPVILNIVAGTAPNKRVLSGTVAERAGMTVGKTYLINCTEGSLQEYEDGEGNTVTTRSFTFDAMSELTVREILDANKDLGPAKVIDVLERSTADATAKNIGVNP